jgi:hypothetical protein
MKTKSLLLISLLLFWSNQGFSEQIHNKLDNVRSENVGKGIAVPAYESIGSQFVIQDNSSTVSFSNELRNSDRSARNNENRNDLNNVDISEPSSIVLIGVGFALMALARLRKSFSFSKNMKIDISNIKKHFIKENYLHPAKKAYSLKQLHYK